VNTGEERSTIMPRAKATVLGVETREQPTIATNTLFSGDNLPILHEYTEELLHGAQVKMSPQHGTFREAQKARVQEPDHLRLDL
jgi:hypothetical protein